MRHSFAVAVALAAGSAAAQEVGADGPSFISEIRAGGLAHDIGFLGSNEESGQDLNAELLFSSPAFLEAVFAPRPHLGIQVNTDGATSQLYAGLTWTLYPFDAPFWVAGAVGGTVHNGELRSFEPGEKSLGSRLLFRLAAEVGVDVTDHISVSLYYDHESNAGLAEENEGLTNAGVRVGWRF